MNLVSFFNEIKNIYGFCPCCGELFRLSEAELFTKEAPPRNQFDAIDESVRRLEQAVARWDKAEDEIRANAREKGQKEARRRVRQMATDLARGTDLHDVKVLFDPVEFVVFRGLSRNDIKAIEFVDCEASNLKRGRLQKSLESALQAGNVDWQEWRINERGVIEPGHRRALLP